MKLFKKNQVVIFVIALMLMTAGYLNYTNQNSNGDLLPTSSLLDSEEMASIGDATLVSANQVTENVNKNENIEQTEIKNEVVSIENVLVENEVEEDSYFAQSRLDRDNMYSQMIANYQKILETDNLSSSEKTSAQKEITRINNEKNAIMIVENLIKTKGFTDVVIFVNNGNVTGIIKAEKVDEVQIAQIQNIITRELDIEADKINISSKN